MVLLIHNQLELEWPLENSSMSKAKEHKQKEKYVDLMHSAKLSRLFQKSFYFSAGVAGKGLLFFISLDLLFLLDQAKRN